MPRSVSNATIWVSVPLIEATAKKNARVSAQKRQDRSKASPVVKPRCMRSSGIAALRAASSRDGSRMKIATGMKARITMAMPMPT